ncbi:conserved hypothetical protein [Histoplasma capsulatum G186AR]|uniref:Fungal-type protein kinase domain-containing protein n=2 Tax=Ajellomyces capsulatus TaxID=5037 RepID=C0NW59_AJECG|nr:uncharacterized protein HCBG_07389 [Histoplasma capsulatum G186AR]EEH04164.1 conserved hypothetical protein [Histoplasma capsulatum G186AR]KAG5291113.1 hypothetical protein I7I52_08335 [Histoplasma capsulatum]QSS68416.1 hypothetical protein I7I50_07819 [Histoplasma capsulatum G186AR]
MGRKRRSPDKATQPSGREQGDELTFSVQSMQRPSRHERRGDEPYDSRILRCVVVSPAVRQIYRYKSPLELLKALRDAIKAYQWLYLDGKILYRDSSENDIVTTDPAKADGSTGILIDLDLAKEVGSGRSSARHQTGTREFMAIDVLLTIDHTYRHDLESFFYVLIWQCAHHGWGKSGFDRPKDTMLKEWYTGNYEKKSQTANEATWRLAGLNVL